VAWVIDFSSMNGIFAASSVSASCHFSPALPSTAPITLPHIAIVWDECALVGRRDSPQRWSLPRMMQRNPRWEVEVSTGWAMRAAGR
jgi:hypothetical protein